MRFPLDTAAAGASSSPVAATRQPESEAMTRDDIQNRTCFPTSQGVGHLPRAAARALRRVPPSLPQGRRAPIPLQVSP
jgi:hypothetical protein